MPRSVVRLPSQVQPPFEVYVSGVPQAEGVDYEIRGRELVFEGRMLRKDEVSGWRWLLGSIGIGTYRQDDSVDVRYALDGRPMVAEGLAVAVVDED
ncbi:MAG TPA: hypothetical protein VFG42_26840 [Baekduia sp.]|uniref:hypothetical protein n=1 Tax=Baekduia sp. TaxID=2600305 RepID=UPI002D7999B5|nr:hypothetical protein [Baekduia sp.]HET6510441.1 hypothetical protein [Baekduia sp.]